MPFPLSSTLPACFAWCVEPPIAAARVAALEEAWRDALAAWLGGLDHPRDGQVQDNTDYLYVKGKPVWIAPVLLAAVIDGQGEVLQLLHGKAGREGAYRSSHGQGPGGQRKGAEVATAHTVRLLATLPALRKAMHEHCAAVTPSLPLYQPQHDSADTSRSAGSRAAARTTVLRLDGHAVTTIAMQYGHTTAVLVVRKEWQGVRITLPASAAGVQAVASTLPALHAAVAALQPSLGHIADLAKVK